MGSQRHRPSSGDDYRINGRMPPSSPNVGTMMRGVMDYQQSPFDTAPQNRSFISPRPSTPSCGCGCDGDDDVFHYGYPMQSTPRIGTPQYGRAGSYYEGPLTNSYGSNSWDTPSLGIYRRPSSINAPAESICWEDNSRAGSSKYDYEEMLDTMSGYLGEEGNSGQASPPPARKTKVMYVPRPVLPSWPDTPDGWRRQGRLGRFDRDQPQFDFETRHTLPLENPPHRLPSYVSGQTRKGSNFKWSVDANGKPSLLIHSLEAVENMNQVHDLTSDSNNKFIKQQGLSPVMLLNNGAVGEWA